MFQNKVDSLHEQVSVTEEQVHGKTVTTISVTKEQFSVAYN